MNSVRKRHMKHWRHHVQVERTDYVEGILKLPLHLTQQHVHVNFNAIANAATRLLPMSIEALNAARNVVWKCEVPLEPVRAC